MQMIFAELKSKTGIDKELTAKTLRHTHVVRAYKRGEGFETIFDRRLLLDSGVLCRTGCPTTSTHSLGQCKIKLSVRSRGVKIGLRTFVDFTTLESNKSDFGLIILGIRLTRDSWPDDRRDLKCRKARPQRPRLQMSEALMLQSVPPYVDTQKF
jgi:hypothetical protein